MDIQIEIPLNAVVFCEDGEVGESIELVIDPEDQMITHLVVLEHIEGRQERLVPISFISAIRSERIQLRCKKSAFKTFDIFCERDVILQPQDSLLSDHRSSMYNFPVTRRIVVESKSVPNGKLSFDEDTFIEAADGRVGKLEKFLVSAESKCITHLVVRNSALLGPREIVVPITAIERFDDQSIYLKLTRKEVRDIKGVPVLQ